MTEAAESPLQDAKIHLEIFNPTCSAVIFMCFTLVVANNKGKSDLLLD
jgi:hypothetical protein